MVKKTGECLPARREKENRQMVLAFLYRFSGGGGASSSVDAHVGILAFEVARAMSRLVTLQRALTPSSVEVLRSTTVQSVGVNHLNGSDDLTLLRLACAEMLDDLDRAAAAISRLASRSPSRSPWPRGFDQVYADLKSGTANFDRKLEFPKKTLEKKLRKMEALVSSTDILYSEMETLAEMQASEQKLQRWKNYSGPMTAGATVQQSPPGADVFLKKLAAQKKLVHKLQQDSLWAKRKVKMSELMARTAVTVFSRICEVFNRFVPELPVVDTRDGKCRSNPNPNPLHVRVHPRHLSGPLDQRYSRGVASTPITSTKFSGPIFATAEAMTSPKTDLTKWTARILQPPPGTVGAAGLALRYADLIQLTERMFHSPEYCGEEDREELYQMLPGSLRAAIRTKLKGATLVAADRDGLRAAAERALEWLAPIADDTTKWFSDRSCEKQRINPEQKVLMLQTLQISNQTKAEAAIVDVLVGLSFAYQCQRG